MEIWRALVERYGADAVYRTGIDVLGHPPTWTPSMSDVLQVQAALEKGENDVT